MRVPTIFTAVDRFSHVVDKMTRKTSVFSQSAEAAAMRTSRRFNDAGTSLLASGAGMAVGIGLAVNEAVKFEKAMSNVSTTIDSTPELMKRMSDSVLDMATKVPVPISQLTDALYDVVSAGIDAKDSMYVLKQSALLGVSGLGTAKEGVDIITSALNSFNLKATESANVANMVFKAVKYGKTTVSGLAESFGSSSALVKNANVSLEEYLATTATLTTTGMTASRAQTQISSAVTALIKPSKTMSKIFDKLGVKDVPAWIKTNGSPVKSLQIVRDEGEKMGLLSSKAFGRKEGFSAMLSLLGPLAEKYKIVMGDIVSGTDSMTEAVAKQQKTFSAQFQIMKNKVTALAITIGNELMPRISGFMDILSPIVSGVTGWISRNEWLATTILNITVGLLALGAIAKVGALLFMSYARVIRIFNFVVTTSRAIIHAYNLTMLAASVSGRSFIGMLLSGTAPMLAWVAPLLAIVAVLGLVAWSMRNSSIISAKFAQDKATHSKIVSGEYETMEQRISKANERIVASMKKLKMDLDSAKKTGKTIAELRRERGTSIVKSNEIDFIKKNVGKASSSLATTHKNLIIPKIISDSDQAFNEIMREGNTNKTTNTAGTRNSNLVNDISRSINKQQVEVIIKDPGNNAELVRLNGRNYVGGGIPAKTGSTTGVKRQ